MSANQKNTDDISPVIKEMAPIILSEIEKAGAVLLHCHPLPDPDSTCSALAMKFALEQMGKKVTVVRGDSEIPKAFMHFPGASGIVSKSFGEVDLSEFGLFISLDSGSENMVSQIKPPEFPLPIKTIVIDHHRTNKGYGDINLVDTSSPATSFVLYQLFSLWNVSITKEIATNLFMGIYTDTGGFRYPSTDHRVISAGAALAKISPDFAETIFVMENSQTKESIYYQALALGSVEEFLGGSIAISSVSNKDLALKNISEECIRGVNISNILKSVIGWNVGVSMVERKPNEIKVSLRTRDENKYDVSALAAAIGGGGHKAAAGATIKGSLDEAKALVVSKAKELYNL